MNRSLKILLFPLLGAIFIFGYVLYRLGSTQRKPVSKKHELNKLLINAAYEKAQGDST